MLSRAQQGAHWPAKRQDTYRKKSTSGNPQQHETATTRNQTSCVRGQLVERPTTHHAPTTGKPATSWLHQRVTPTGYTNWLYHSMKFGSGPDLYLAALPGDSHRPANAQPYVRAQQRVPYIQSLRNGAVTRVVTDGTDVSPRMSRLGDRTNLSRCPSTLVEYLVTIPPAVTQPCPGHTTLSSKNTVQGDSSRHLDFQNQNRQISKTTHTFLVDPLPLAGDG